MNFNKKLIISYLFILNVSMCQFSMAAGKNDKTLNYFDKIYEDNIKTAILFRGDEIHTNPLYPATIPLLQMIPLVLVFDEIYTDDADYYKAKIIHCNMNWKPTKLPELQYLHEYNEFNIDNFEFSIATKIPYTHFTFRVPKVKLPGNYLLVIYRENDPNDIIITKRYIVYDQKVNIMGNVGLSSGVVHRKLNQQIEFVIDYAKYPISNPYLDIHVVLKQNNRWDNAIYDLKPTAIKEDISQLEYRHFNFENNFKAGNEFRFFDIRSIHYGGMNVEKTNITETQIDAYLYFNKSRGTEPYSIIRDMNGGFVIENSEGRDNFLESDYINVHFILDLKKNINEDIFITGKFTDWRFDGFNKMKYIDVSGLYIGNLLLKQGLYDFIYYLPYNQENPTLLEGNHFQTKNYYEIIVYYNDQMLNTDVIIGYVKLN